MQHAAVASEGPATGPAIIHTLVRPLPALAAAEAAATAQRPMSRASD